jgi:hypothetical protein
MSLERRLAALEARRGTLGQSPYVFDHDLPEDVVARRGLHGAIAAAITENARRYANTCSTVDETRDTDARRQG